MPRRETPFVPDIYYHFYNRGNNRQAIFFEPDNYLYFLRGVKKYLVPFVSIVVYCLMPTHYHILARVKQTSEFFKNYEVFSTTVSAAMMRFSVSYTKAINKRFSRVGSLFQGQFQAKAVKSDAHLRNLCVYTLHGHKLRLFTLLEAQFVTGALYIHANPVKDGLVAMPEDWIYSNYLEWLGQRDGTLVDREFIQEQFGSPNEYQELVVHFLKTRYLPDDMRTYLQAFD